MHDLVTAIAVVSAVANVAAFAWIVRRARSRRKLEDAALQYLAVEAEARRLRMRYPERDTPQPHERLIRARRGLMRQLGWKPRETVAQKRPTRAEPPGYAGWARPEMLPACPPADDSDAADTRMPLATITAALIVFAFFALAAVAWGSPREAWCPVPWDVEWCVRQSGEEARALCAEVNPTTRSECKDAMRFVNESLMRAPVKAQAVAPLSAAKAAATSPPFGVGFKLAPSTRICWEAIGGGCPSWLADLGDPRGCCRLVNLAASVPALTVAPCGPNSGSNDTPATIIRQRYGKPAVGGFVGGLWNERFSMVCSYLNTLPLAPGYAGPASHMEGMDCGASNCMAGAGGGGGPILACGNGLCQTNRGETCETCPADCCPTPPPPPPPPTPFCGDNACAGAETCATCAQDCGACPPTPPPVVNPPVLSLPCDEVRIVAADSTGKWVNLLLVRDGERWRRVCEVRQ